MSKTAQRRRAFFKQGYLDSQNGYFRFYKSHDFYSVYRAGFLQGRKSSLKD